MRPFLLFLFLTTAANLSAQDKFEHEQRIDATEVPARAVDFVATFAPSRKVRWYEETSERDTTIEAKTKVADRWYSIEFHRWGALEDVEVKVPYPELPAPVRDSICEQLYRQTERFRIAKTQIQYSGAPALVRQAALGDAPGAVTVRYELVVRAQTEAGSEALEFLFDEQGNQLSRKTIIYNNTDHLDY